MTNKIIILLILLNNFYSISQINELDNFRQKLSDFISYDNSPYEKSESDLQQLKLELDESFREFVFLKDFSSIIDTKEFDELKKRANNNSFNYLYSFFELRRDYNNKTAKNNTNYYIGFVNLYDYASPNIVSIYMQAHSIGNEHYMIYYYKMNNKGNYFIKNINTNEIVYEDQALTSNAALVKFDKIDNTHYLIVEDMGENGQRAFVIKRENNNWKAMNAFRGKSFDIETLNYSEKKDRDARKYLWIASNLKITQHLKDRPFELSWIHFNENTKDLFYKRYHINWLKSEKVNSKWTGEFFLIDDYYIGEDYK